MLFRSGTKEDFDFLGFTFFNTKTRGGKYRLGVRTSKKKLKAKRQAAKGMAAHEADEAGISDNGDVGGNHPRTLQLLRGKWEFSRNTELLGVSEILHLPYAEQTSPEALHEIRQVSAYLELLRKGAALDEGYLELATEGCLKSRMRENRTSGSVRATGVKASCAT